MKAELIQKLYETCKTESVIIIDENSSNEAKDLLLSLDDFKLNREVRNQHIDEIRQAYIDNPDLYKGIIEIQLNNSGDTSNAYVIDGNHRLIAAQMNCMENKPFKVRIHLLHSNTNAAENTIVMNNSQIKWRGKDFLDSYRKQGKPSYIKLYKFIQDNEDICVSKSHIRHAVALAALTNGRKISSLLKTFSSGTLKISDIDLLYGTNIFSEIRKFNSILGIDAFNCRSAILVWIKLRNVTPVPVAEKALKKASKHWITPKDNFDSWYDYMIRNIF